jgi:hypothetical protein
VEGVLDADVNQRPRKPKRSRRPYAFGRPESVDAYREASRLRYAAYDAVRVMAKTGERVEWPEGMYAPGGVGAA